MTELGEIPADWEVAKLDDIASINSSNVDKKSLETEKSVRLCNYMDVYRNNCIHSGLNLMRSTASQVQIDKFLLKKGDVIITKDSETKDDIAQSAYVSEDFEDVLCGYHLSLIRPYKNVYDGQFLSNLFNLQLVRKQLTDKANGTTRYGLTTGTIQNLLIPQPPFPEQQKIAKILSTVDEKIEVIEAKIVQTQELKKGLMQQLLTRGIGHAKFKNSELGEIPESWEIVTLKELGVFSKGKGITKSQLLSRGIPCIRYGEIYTKHHFIIKKFYSFINETTAKTSVKLFKGDILFAGSGETVTEIGKAVAFIEEEEVYAGGDIIILTPTNSNSEFLSYYLNSELTINQRTKFGQGNAIVHISASNLSKIITLNPPIKEQEQIASIITTVDEKLEILQAKKENFTTLKKGLMQQLLTGKLRVKC